MHKPPHRLALIFFLLTLTTLIVTMLLAGALMMLLIQIGLIESRRPLVLVLAMAIASVLVGTVLARFASRAPIAAIVSFRDAAQAVARGDFSVRIREDFRIAELHDMAHHFNIMTRELAGTELLRMDFVENVSHEFKTPLSAIEGYATLLQKRGLDEEKRAEYTDRILRNTCRLSTLTSDILLLSRLEHQETGIHREWFCLDEQLRECILSLEEQWTQKRLEMEVDLDGADYCGSRDLLSHVWVNIIGNAVKFAPEDGVVRVLLRREAEALRVQVADNGAGMSAEVQRRMFEKFYQGDASRSSQGNGLGLSLAKRIVDLHGGRIDVSSAEGRGTAFTVTLPVREADGRAQGKRP